MQFSANFRHIFALTIPGIGLIDEDYTPKQGVATSVSIATPILIEHAKTLVKFKEK